MTEKLTLINVPPSDAKLLAPNHSFRLKTCQRELVLCENKNFLQIDTKNAQLYFGVDAYQFLLETISGLKSKLVAENEIIAQFKDAYRGYLKQKERSSFIIRIIEKLFKDAKEIRSNYLIGIGQDSYSGLSKKILLSMEQRSEKVLILGSGKLAKDLVKILGKQFNIYISARNKEIVGDLVLENKAKSVQWNDLFSYKLFTNIINTIGSTETILPLSFQEEWFSKEKNATFIDLGKPALIDKKFKNNSKHLSLDKLFKFAEKYNEHKEVMISECEIAIKDLAIRRIELLKKSKGTFTHVSK